MAWEPPSEEDFNENWDRPKEALEIVGNVYGHSGARRYILDRLKSDIAVAVGRTARSSESRDHPRSFQRISHILWETWDDVGDDHFWRVGDATFEVERGTTGYDRAAIRFQDIRFHPQSFDGRPKASSDVTESPAAAPKNSGGRPPKPFWDDMWAAITAQLYSGDLKPSKQADIENAMHDWLVGNSHEAGSTQVRVRARKLWESLKE